MRRYGIRDDQWDRKGIPWRDLPKRFGDWKQVHTRHSRWAKSGIWEKVFKVLAADADNEYAMIDSTIVRAHQHATGAPKKLPGRRSDRAQPRRTEHKDPRLGRCPGQPSGLSADGGPSARPRRRRRSATADAGRHPPGRQGFRCRQSG
jgi:hypothetical protein